MKVMMVKDCSECPFALQRVTDDESNRHVCNPPGKDLMENPTYPNPSKDCWLDDFEQHKYRRPR